MEVFDYGSERPNLYLQEIKSVKWGELRLANWSDIIQNTTF